MERRHTKAELIREIDAAWAALMAALDRVSPAHLREIRDAHGWTVTDHLVHLAAWARSVVVVLEGQPRHVGLRVDEQLYLTGDADAINAAIQQHGQATPWSEAVADLQAVHGHLLHLIEPLTDADLSKPTSAYQAETGGDRDARPVIGLIYGNTAHHYREHQQWMERLVAPAGG